MANLSDWHFYFTESDEDEAVIGFYRDAQEARSGRPWFHWLKIRMNHPGKHGLTDETADSDDLDIAMEEHFHKKLDAVFVGRITQGGTRTFYYYAPRQEGFKEECAQLLGSKYAFELGAVLDRDWMRYEEDLCPSELESWCMSAMEMSSVMEERGDLVEVPRRIDHWVNFQDGNTRNLFMDSVQLEKFMVEKAYYASEEDSGLEGLPYALQIYRDDAVEFEHFREVVRYLYKLTEHFMGHFSGFEAFAVMPDQVAGESR